MTPERGHLSPEEVSAFIDGEAGPGDAPSPDQHAATCADCALRIVTAMRLKAASARASMRFAASPETLSRLTAQLRPTAPQKPARLFPIQRWTWSALAASLILAVALFGWRESRQVDPLSAELLDQHLAVLSSGASPEVISSDRHTVKPWFQGKLPFSFNLPDTYPPGTTLRGGNLTYLQGQPAALLLFTIGKHQVSVFLTQSFAHGSLLQSATRSGFVLQYADTHDLRIAAVSDVNPADLALLVAALARAEAGT